MNWTRLAEKYRQGKSIWPKDLFDVHGILLYQDRLSVDENTVYFDDAFSIALNTIKSRPCWFEVDRGDLIIVIKTPLVPAHYKSSMDFCRVSLSKFTFDFKNPFSAPDWSNEIYPKPWENRILPTSGPTVLADGTEFVFECCFCDCEE